MAVGFVRDHTGFSIKTAGAANAVLNISTITSVGNVLIARILFDNFSSASQPTVSTIGKPGSETANWVFVGAARSTSTTAGAQSSGEIWMIKTTVAWPVATYNIGLSQSVTMKATHVQEFSGVRAVLRSTTGTAYSTTTTAASAASSGTTPSIGDLAVGFLFGSNVAAVQAGDTDTTGGSWSTKIGLGSTGGSAATNNYGLAQYKILTAASHQTFNNSAAMTAGNGSIVGILEFEPAVIPVASFTTSDTSIDEGQSVTFTDTSTNVPTTWSWNFGSGTPATANTQGPHSVTFNTPGSISINLTAGNAAGNDAADTTVVTVRQMGAGRCIPHGCYEHRRHRRCGGQWLGSRVRCRDACRTLATPCRTVMLRSREQARCLSSVGASATACRSSPTPRARSPLTASPRSRAVHRSRRAARSRVPRVPPRWRVVPRC